jgi:hypothetical protein
MKNDTEKEMLKLESKFHKKQMIYVIHNHDICKAEVRGMYGFIDEFEENHISLRLAIEEKGTKVKTLADVHEDRCFASEEELIASLTKSKKIKQ